MRMIRWMFGYAGLDRVRNVVTREKARIAPLEEKMRELRWFRHVTRRSVNIPARRCESINLMHCKRGRGRSKTSWNEVIKGDMKFMGLTEDMAQDRNL